MKLDADIFEQSPARFQQSPKFDHSPKFDDGDPQSFCLPGIDTSKDDVEINSKSPTKESSDAQICEKEKKSEKSPLWDLSPIQHNEQGKENKEAVVKNEEISLKKSQPIISQTRSDKPKKVIPLPSLSSNRGQTSNSARPSQASPQTVGPEQFQRQAAFVPQRPTYPTPSPPGYRLQVSNRSKFVLYTTEIFYFFFVLAKFFTIFFFSDRLAIWLECSTIRRQVWMGSAV